MNSKRGVFILIEGLDCCGKTTQTKLLHEALTKMSSAAELLRFPDRTTPTGKLIDAYLTSKDEQVNDRAIHLLFTANRWEAAEKIEAILNSGKNIVMDRYAYSGAVFSASKSGMDMNWCWQPEIGLPRPDAVIFLDLPVDSASKREDYGAERYENVEFQEKVRLNFHKLIELDHSQKDESRWHFIDANDTIEKVQARVFEVAQRCIQVSQYTPLASIGPLQPSSNIPKF
uniref:Thymidylate kinase n=1 Tax=Albugo laibachii Nc14 TaxID=890382 RepID=F0WKZ1_9STRA|nr:thymidylate kinase putative [Albugo laibachii Nc14]|eukprot:CCA21950.1 thymidylate kinase putative [Albugo laibachii Nc14]